jgi:hypothetical protein
MAKYNIAGRYGDLNLDQASMLEEAISDAFSDFSQTKPPAGLIGNVFSRIKSFFAALDNGFKGLGFQTADDVFGRVERGELLPGMGERAAEVQGLQAQRVTAETSEPVQDRTGAKLPTKPVSTRPVTESVPQLPPLPQAKPDEPSMPIQRGSVSAVPMSLLTTPEALQRTGDVLSVLDKSDPNESLRALNLAAERGGLAEWEARAIAFGRAEGAPGSERYSLSTQNPDQQYSVRQAPPDVLEEAQRYYEANGILPYTQETITSVGVETKPEKFSLKREGKYGNHDVLGIPVNKNGTVTLYFPADNDIAREVMRSRKLVPTEGTDRIYLTNESSAKTVLGNPGNISQQVGGANVLVQIDPGMLQIDQEYEDGRIDFFIPVKEGKAFFDKMKLTRLFTVEGARNKGFNTDRTLNQVGDSIVSAVDSYMSANAKGRQAIVKQARDVLREQHNIGTLLGENGKLEKTRIGDYGLTYEGQSVASLGLGLASAQRLNTQERVTTCPKSAICEGLCLGDTSGQNQLYGGEDQFRQGPRLSQYLKTEALMLNPEAFGVLLSHEIQSFVNKTKAMDYQPAIRLNVTSDIPPKVYKAIIDAFPNVMFYDYTKLFGNKSIAPNHHLTYSSSGASQRVGNELIVNKLSTWDKDVQKLLGGDNVAMAFTSRKSMPKTVRDEKTGENFEVWNGDNYDARFLDPKRDDGKGYIIGLTNKDRTVKPEEAAKQYDGFFMDYDPKRDGDTLIIKDQARLNAQATQPIQIVRPKERYSLRGANTPEFREWFGNSTIVNEQGSPRVMYHGTARDITEFKAKQAGAIFVTEDPRFAEDFGIQSETWMIDHADQFLPEQELKKAIALGVTKMTPGMSKQKRTEMLAEMLKFPTMSIIRDPDATKIRDVVLNKMPSRQNILPVYVRSENPFDYQNPEDVQGVIDYIEENVLFSEIYEAFNRDLDITDDLRSELESGRWASIENPIVQEAIRENRHDGFYIREGGRKNLAVYDPNQLKSVTGNIGTYGQREPSLEEAKQFGLTVEEAKAAQKRGDIRYSLRNTNTPEFKQWFRKSPVVNAVDKPQMMFHGTSLDIEEFIPGKTGAIYVSPDPEFAGTFARYSQEREIRKLGENLDQDLEAKQRILDPIIDEAMANGDLTNRNLPYHRDLAQVGLIKDLDQYSKEYWMNWFLEKPMRDAAHSTGVGPALREALANMLTTGRNVMPLYVNPQKPFDYENNTHVNKVAKLVFEYDPDTYESANPKVQKYQRDTLINGLKAGDWRVLEEPIVQEAIKELGFDAFYVKEQDVKNLGLYKPNQLKSAIGNTGAFSPETGKVRYSLRSKTPPPQNIQRFFDQAERLETTPDISDLRDAWIGGVSDSGLNEAAYYINDVPGGKDYTKNVQKLAKQMLGNRIKGFRLMSTEELENIRAGDLSYYAAFTLDPNTALSFANFVQNRKIAPKNLVVVEADINPGDIHMIGKDAESEVVVDMFKLGDQKVQEFAQPVRYSLRNTDTPAFKQWFKDSKVVDKKGDPLVVYHGTDKTFDAFNLRKRGSRVGFQDDGFYFSDSPGTATTYATMDVYSGALGKKKDAYLEPTDFFKRFLSRLGLVESAPQVVPAFLSIKNPYKTTGARMPGRRELIKQGYDGIQYTQYDGTTHWVAFEPTQIKSSIGNIGTFDPENPDIRYSLRQQAGQTLGQSYLDTVQRTTTPRVEKGFKDRISEAMSATPFAKFRQMFINKYERIEYFSKQLAKQFGDAVLLADQSAIAAALMSDRAAGVAAESFKSGIPVYAKGYTYVDNMGGKVKGLMEILMPLAQKQDPFVYQMYQDYAARRRGVRLDSEGKITPFTRQELSEIPKIEKAFPEFKQVFEDYQRYNEGLVRYMRDTGVIDAKAAQEWMRYGDYVPFYRQLEGESTVGPSIFSAISGVKAPKKLKGGDAPLGEFLETVVRNSRAAIEAGMRNVAANRVVNNFQRLNSPSTGGRLVEKTSEQNKNRPDVVTVRENGKDAYYKVADPLLVQSLQALNIPQIPGLDILAKPAEFLREMVTRDPAFIGASVLRESLSAWITTGQKLTPVASGVNQFVKILANASPTVQALRRAGIGSGYEFKGDVQATAGVFGDQLKRMAGEMTAAQKAVMPLRAMWDSLDKASTAADLSTRAAVFERVMQETGNEAEAIYQAMEVINFSRKGSSPIIQIFAAIIPFLNARIQGLDLLYRAGFGELASATRLPSRRPLCFAPSPFSAPRRCTTPLCRMKKNGNVLIRKQGTTTGSLGI